MSEPRDPTVTKAPTPIDVELESLDLSKEKPEAVDGSVPEPSTLPYNVDQDRERVRGALAYWLILILAGTITLSFAGLLVGQISMEDLKELLTIIFGPLIALVAAATGFYFGGKK